MRHIGRWQVSVQKAVFPYRNHLEHIRILCVACVMRTTWHSRSQDLYTMYCAKIKFQCTSRRQGLELNYLAVLPFELFIILTSLTLVKYQV
jgi:hypothetical protein